MKEFITEEEIEKAINYLSSSAKDFAKWRSRVEFLKHHRKSVRSMESIKLTGRSMVENNTKAEASQPYRDVLIEIQEAEYEYTLISAYRKAAETKVEAWRTISSSNRKGHL